MLTLLIILWAVWELKYILFWLYLWQLKEYHIGRFVDHFKTHKGKKVLFSFGQILKLVLLVFLILNEDLFNLVFSILILAYIAEACFFARAIINRSFKKPVRTVKTIFLSLVSFAVVFLFIFFVSGLEDLLQLKWLLVFDILASLIVSAIVLLFQPFFVALRNAKLKKAEDKLKNIKSLSNIKVIAITGSFGKTSTKEFLSKILSKKFRVLSTKEHQNSEIGIASCILNDLKPSHQILIAEVGAYNKGKVKEVCSVLKPNIGIVTGVNEQHLSLFGSMENLLLAEGGGELASALSKKGLLIVNGDNKHCLDLYKKFDGNKKIYSYSNKFINSDIWADSITVRKDRVLFLAIDKSREMANFEAHVLGRQNVQNLLAAILTAKELGMSFGEISEALKYLKQEHAGMVLKQGKHEIDIIDSTYSANPDGVFADLDYLSIFGQKKVIVMPCLIELGNKSAQIHEKIGRRIGKICDLAIITSKDKFKELKRGAVEAGMGERNILLCDKPEDIFAMITVFCKSGDAVLLEGRVPAGLINLLT